MDDKIFTYKKRANLGGSILCAILAISNLMILYIGYFEIRSISFMLTGLAIAALFRYALRSGILVVSSEGIYINEKMYQLSIIRSIKIEEEKIYISCNRESSITINKMDIEKGYWEELKKCIFALDKNIE